VSGGTILKQFYDAVRLRDMAKARAYLVVVQAIYQSVDNPNDVTVTHDFRIADARKRQQSVD
jgi:hypothetical protein